jgi:hypothetical protein
MLTTLYPSQDQVNIPPLNLIWDNHLPPQSLLIRYSGIQLLVCLLSSHREYVPGL